jgi:hypothetical protein
MKATHYKLTIPQDVEVTTPADIERLVAALDQSNNAILILENQNSDYIQCMAGDKGYVAEARFQLGDGKFKHFRIGYQETSKVWDEVNGMAGPIRLLGHEILKRHDVEKIFKFFFEKSEIESGYNKRNITKIFTQG